MTSHQARFTRRHCSGGRESGLDASSRGPELRDYWRRFWIAEVSSGDWPMTLGFANSGGMVSIKLD